MSLLPRITIITPCLNQAQWLERTLCSVLDQGYENLEYIVVDGGSTDGSEFLIRQYDHELSWWRSRPNRGPAEAINQALSKANGEIIGILPGDDLYLPGSLGEVARRMMQNDQPAWLVGNYQRIDESDRILGCLSAQPANALGDLLNCDNGLLPGAATFYRRSAIQKHSGFANQIKSAFAYEMASYLLAEGKSPAIVDSTLAATRQRQHSDTVADTLQEGMEYVRTAERYAERLAIVQRRRLWQSCKERRRIYALADAQARLSDARRHLWQQLLRRPWWLNSDRYRQTLLRGVAQPTPSVATSSRRAA